MLFVACCLLMSVLGRSLLFAVRCLVLCVICCVLLSGCCCLLLADDCCWALSTAVLSRGACCLRLSVFWLWFGARACVLLLSVVVCCSLVVVRC